MRLFRIAVSWLGLAAVVAFLIANIRTTDAGVGYIWLLLAAAFAGLLIISREDFLTGIRFRTSALFLLAFLAWFLLRLLLDVPDPGAIKGVTIGTSGGLVFALLLGILVALFVGTLFELQRVQVSDSVLTLLFLAACLALCAGMLSSLLSLVREDLFLIEVDRRRYQRPGSFIVILSVLISMVLAGSATRHFGESRLVKFVNAASVAVYLGATAALLVASQLIGSNGGFVVTFALAGATLLWVMRPANTAKRYAWQLSSRPMPSATVLRLSVRGLAWRAVLLLAFAVMSIAMVFALTPLSMQQFRIFGFAQGRLGGNSLTSRMRILAENFSDQLALNPLFGNMLADDLTTGPGSYAHSLVSLLSHLGLVGALLFVVYIVKVYRDVSAAGMDPNGFFDNRDIGMLRLLLITIILGFALLATFFTWMPLWFVLGAICPPVLLRSERSMAVISGRYSAPNHLRRLKSPA